MVHLANFDFRGQQKFYPTKNTKLSKDALEAVLLVDGAPDVARGRALVACVALGVQQQVHVVQAVGALVCHRNKICI